MKRRDKLRHRKEQQQVQESLAKHAVRQGTMSKAACSLKPKNLVYCPDAGRKKMLFSSQEKALRFMEYNNENIRNASGFAPVRAYFCRLCGGYHLTSSEVWEECDNFGRTDFILGSLTKSNAKVKEQVPIAEEVRLEKPTYLAIMHKAKKHTDNEHFLGAITCYRHAFATLEKEAAEWESIDLQGESKLIASLYMDNILLWAKVMDDKYKDVTETTTEQKNEINNYCGQFKFVTKICADFGLWNKFQDYDVVYKRLYDRYVEIRNVISLYSRIAQLRKLIRKNIIRLEIYHNYNHATESQRIIRRTKEYIEELYDLDPICDTLITYVDELMKYQRFLDEQENEPS